MHTSHTTHSPVLLPALSRSALFVQPADNAWADTIILMDLKLADNSTAKGAKMHIHEKAVPADGTCEVGDKGIGNHFNPTK
jgi:hypothetical protein